VSRHVIAWNDQDRTPLPSSRHHQSCDDCLEDKGENYQHRRQSVYNIQVKSDLFQPCGQKIKQQIIQKMNTTTRREKRNYSKPTIPHNKIAVIVITTLQYSSIVGVNGNGDARSLKPKGPKSEARKAERGWVLGSGCSPPHQLRDLESAVSSPVGVRSKSSLTWQFRTFHMLTKPLLHGVNFAHIKFISVKFSWGPSHRRQHNQIFVGSGPRTPSDRRLWLPELFCAVLYTTVVHNDVHAHMSSS